MNTFLPLLASAIIVVGFVLSAVINNLITNININQAFLKFFKGDALFMAGACILISANEGGSFSYIKIIITPASFKPT